MTMKRQRIQKMQRRRSALKDTDVLYLQYSLAIMITPFPLDSLNAANIE